MSPGTSVSVATVTTTSTPLIPSSGDTIIYKITQWSAPQNFSVFDNSSPFKDITAHMNLLGSVIGFKILSAEVSSYQYGLYIQAGNGPLELTLPSNLVNVTGSVGLNILASFLANTGTVPFNVPPGAVLPIVLSNSSLYDFFNGTGFWLKVSSWQTEKDLLNHTQGYSYIENGNNITVTKIINATHCTGNVSLTYTESTNVISTQLQFRLNIKDQTNTTEPVLFTLDYDHTEYTPLPSTLGIGNILKYVVTTSSLIITPNLDVNTQEFLNLALAASTALSTSLGGAKNLDDAITYLTNQTSSQVGKFVAQYTITGSNGVFYNASVLLDGSSSSSNYTFNGFTGTALYQSTNGNLPLIAPVVTPDVSMWDGMATSINALGNTYVKMLSASIAGPTIKSNYTAAGFTSGPNLVFALGYSNQSGYKIYGVGVHIDFKYNASINTSEVSSPAVYLTVTSDINGGIAISNEGYVLATGIKASITIAFNAAVSLGGGGSSLPLQGSIQIIFEHKVKLSDKSIGVPSNILNLANSANQIIDAPLTTSPSTPGFEVIPLFVGFAILPIIVHRHKHTK